MLCSVCVYAAPVFICTEVQDEFYRWLNQQPENPDNSLTITPSGSFIGLNGLLFYTPNVNLSEKLDESTWAAGFEISHTLLLSFVLKFALWMNPVIPVYLPVSFGVGWYRFLRLWRSRLWLAWQLASWGKDTLSDAIWPEKKLITLNLSSSDIGVVIGELDIPTDRLRPIELNIYTDGDNKEPFNGCDGLTTFDCLINSFRATGVHRWKLQWMHDSYEVRQWFYQTENEPLAMEPVAIQGVVNRDIEGEDEIHHSAGILSAVFSETLLQSNLELFYPFNPVSYTSVSKNWFGESSTFISLGCLPEQGCPGLYITEGMRSGSISVERMTIDAGLRSSEFLEPFDQLHAGEILYKQSQLYRIPESVITVAFEILEELIEELGYRAVGAIAGLPSASTSDLPEQAAPAEEDATSGFSEAEFLGKSRSSQVSLNAFNDVIEQGRSGAIPRLKVLAGMLDIESIKQGFHKAVRLNHLDMAEILLQHLPDDWVKSHLKRAVRRPFDIELRKIVQFLPESFLEFAMMEAVNYGLLESMGILNVFASEETRDRGILQAAYRGRTEIVRLLIPDRSQDVLSRALNRAYDSGFQLTMDFIFDHLDSSIIKDRVRPGIIKGRLIRALEGDQMDRVNELIDLAPPEIRKLLPTLLARYSWEQAKKQVAAYAADDNFEASLKQSEYETSLVLKVAGGMNDSGRRILLNGLIAKGKSTLVPSVFNTFSADQKINYLFELAEQGNTDPLELLMQAAKPVTKDRVLLESVRMKRPQIVIAELARQSDQPSIRRAAIYATKTGLSAEAELLEGFLPQEPPIYHLNDEQKICQKEMLRKARNRKLGRRELGDNYYVYMDGGRAAQMLYIVAHGEELPKRGPFRHVGYYQLGFAAPDGHILKTNHIEAFLEGYFTPKEIIPSGEWVKEYGLSKNYNSGWAFKNMRSECGRKNEDLMEKKAAPAVLSGLRKHFSTIGRSIDFLTVRGKDFVELSDLLHDLSQADWAKYKQVIVGCCRGADDAAPVYMPHRKLTRNYLTYAPELFMKVANYLKVHPAFWDSPIWEYYHPDTAPDIWLNSLEDYRDQMVSHVRKRFKDNTQRAKKDFR